MLNIPLFARINPFVQTTPYRELYRCYPAAFSTKKDLEDGDKVILPPSALHHLASLKVTYPLVFELSNPRTGKKTHCGVLEFSSNEGECYVPYWIMQNLLIKSGAMIQITNASLPKGNFVKFQPHETSFTLLSNPRVVLEKALRRYTCLTQGDTVNITHDGKRYEVDILEVRPGTAITVIETDVNVEFAAPKDYKEPPKSEKKLIQHININMPREILYIKGNTKLKKQWMIMNEKLKITRKLHPLILLHILLLLPILLLLHHLHHHQIQIIQIILHN